MLLQVLKRAVGWWETVHGADDGLSLEQSAENRSDIYISRRIGVNGFSVVNRKGIYF